MYKEVVLLLVLMPLYNSEKALAGACGKGFKIMYAVKNGNKLKAAVPTTVKILANTSLLFVNISYKN